MHWGPGKRLRASKLGPAAALVAQLPRASASLTAFWVSALLVSALLPLGFALASGALVGSVPQAIRAGMQSAAGHRLLIALGATALIFALLQSATPLLGALGDVLGRRLNGSLRRRVMVASLAPSGIGHLEDPAMLDLVSQAQGVGTGQFTPGQATTALTGMVSNRLGGAVAGCLLFTYRWWLGVLVIGANLIIVRIQSWELKRSLAGLTDEAETFRRAGYIRDLALTPGAAKETRIFGLDTWLVKRFGEEWASAMTAVWQARQRGRWAVFASIGAAGLVEGSAYWLIGNAAAHHHITLGHLTVLIGAVGGASAILGINSSWLDINYGASAIPQALELEKRAAGVATSGHASADGRPAHSIRFENVRFAYPGSDHEIYSGLDLEIEAGRSLAIVGQNGAGKTTLMKLLARLYDPTSGAIFVDGVSLRDIDAGQWQRRIAAIFQDFVRFALEAGDNIAFAAAPEERDFELLERAARRAGADELMAGLSQGWDTVLSRQFSEGVELSGGEWQRVALARALAGVESGAGLLILDEPSANLDVRAEAELYDRFLDLTQGLTTVLISHRFSTVRRADRIVVLDGGRVIESGTHDRLLAAGGRYAEMFRLQAARFHDPSDPAPATRSAAEDPS
ncbi:MAG TPA: ABC transporter ATP-binding protein [Acidimicrobiales bacterium]|nr:ABC transporter ATP-binding protein [Acidimicrobiales bacterium]